MNWTERFLEYAVQPETICGFESISSEFPVTH